MFEAIFGALIGCAGYCVALCFGTTRGTRFSGRAWWRIGPPCIAMGISGTLLFIAGNKALYGPAGWYSTAGWIIFACALSFLIRVYITESNKEERLQRNFLSSTTNVLKIMFALVNPKRTGKKHP